MRFTNTPFEGLVVVDSAMFRDERGTFLRLHCDRKFADAGLPGSFVQTNLSTNTARHTLRGMHYQAAPHAETKLVRCISGAVLDVAIDLRQESPTFTRHFAIELSGMNAIALLVPKGFAHGYLTLTSNAAVLYQVSAYYAPNAERGVRWNDPRFAIPWPATAPIISTKDATWPDFEESSR